MLITSGAGTVHGDFQPADFHRDSEIHVALPLVFAAVDWKVPVNRFAESIFSSNIDEKLDRLVLPSSPFNTIVPGPAPVV